ncbi:hypothetical protein OC834_006213 [Tilletia horrida]|uniref:Uncharacterized protein n=1 Tax=Tilletia horrida TaxID=155126 RepID=A0AAN6GDH3_9BASI|nr:hypothetical protein OC834_006213 [Tilletia horrida]KAK0535431.1 hypothetical protein OC842_002325 [Tilletia horrida]
MPPSPRVPLTPNQQRIRLMVLSLPLAVATSVVLARRLFYGEEQRKLKPDDKIAVRPA